jgi:hypothetical protein
VNLAFVEATYALESPMEFSKLVLIVDDDLAGCGKSVVNGQIHCPSSTR